MKITNKYCIKIISIIAFTFVLGACAAPKVKQNVLMPANALGFQDAKKITIIDFAGDKHGEFTQNLSNFFSKIRVKTKPYFTIVDRKLRDSLLSERKFQMNNDSLVGTKAVQFGKLANADTIISGNVMWPNFRFTRYAEKRKKCAVRSDVKSKNSLGISYYKCLQYKTYRVSCRKTQDQFRFKLKAVGVKSGSVIHSESYQAGTDYSHCEDSSQALKTREQLQRDVMQQAIDQLRKDVAPYVVVMTIELMDGDDSELNSNSHAKKLLESGIEFAENKRMKRACDLFDQAHQNFQTSPAIIYNLGVCAEMKNDLERASKLYRSADSLLKKPEDVINTALSRIENRKLKSADVKKQLR